MKARGVLLSLLVAATIGAYLVQPHAVMAKSDYEVESPSFDIGFRLKGSHGFELLVSAAGHRRVSLTAWKGPVSATYTVPGRATSKRIEANFGTLGKVSVRFDASPAPKARKARQRRRSCRGHPAISIRGTFHGTIRFRGELGYTATNSRQAKGNFYRTFRRVCKKRSRKPDLPLPGRRWLAEKQPRLLINTLSVRSKANGRRTEFAILQLKDTGGSKKAESSSLSFVVVAQGERAGRMAIERSVFTIGDNGSLLIGDPGLQPVTATVALPKPFSGTARYLEETGFPPSWTGDLGVWLPGTGTVPLTGEGFTASLCQAHGIRQTIACFRRFDQSLEGSS
jgi:hypothetical protein